MKKRILGLMTAVVACFAGFGFASCGETEQEKCDHISISETTLAATCTSKGQINKVCLDCDYVFPAVEIPALGHDLGDSEEFAATCTSAKIIAQQCDRCNEVIEEVIGEALGHDYKQVQETPATCNDPAIRHYECDRDGCTAKTTEVVEGSTALGHNYVHMVEKDVEVSCTQAGEEVWECTNEGCEDSYSNIVSPPLEHLPENEGTIVAPTCTEKGYTSMHCTRPECGEDYQIDLVPELGHSLGNEELINASCDSMGYNRQACERQDCSYEIRSNVVENVAHNFDNSGVCSGCGKGAVDAFALICGDTSIYSIDKVGDEYIVYAPSYKFYTYVVMPAEVLTALYAQNVHSFNVLIGSRTDSVEKALGLNIQGGQDIYKNVYANEMVAAASYAFADENGIFEKDKNGISFGVYYRSRYEMNEAIGEKTVTAYAISFQYNYVFDIENVNTYFKTTMPYTYNQESGIFTFTDVNTEGYNTIVLRKELLEYYLNNGYKTLTVKIDAAAGQHFSKNLTASYGNAQYVTTGNTNSAAVLRDLRLEVLVSGDVTLDLYAVDTYGRPEYAGFSGTAPMDSILLTLEFEQAKPSVTAFVSGNGLISDYVSDLEVTASEPNYTDATATMVYNVTVGEYVYAFINFDSALINEMIAKGYTKVTITIALPGARYIHAELNGTGLTTETRHFGSVAGVEFSEVALTADGTYNVRFFFGETTDVTVTMVFSN